MSDRSRAINRKEVEAILQRIHALPRAAQLTLFSELRDYLAVEDVPETQKDQQIRLRQESLEVMTRVAAHYRLAADTAPTVSQWRSAPAELTAGWSATRMAEIWGRFRFAQATYRGEHLSGGSAQRSIRRATVRRRLTFEDELLGVQRWLDTKPRSGKGADYDEFVAEQNDAIRLGQLNEKPLRQAAYIVERLGITFDDVVAVLRDGADLAGLRAARQAERLQRNRGKLGVVGARGAAAIVGHLGSPTEILNHPGFPRPVLKLGRRYGWLASDVEAFRDGRPVPQRRDYEMQDQVVGTAEMAELRGYPSPASVIALLHRNPHLFPEPDGRLDNAIYWLRSTVEAWLPNAPTRRPGRPVKKRPDRPERGE